MARPFGGRQGRAVAPATPALRRLLGSLHEPNAWTAGILLATGVAVIARHPIAHALGTEADSPAVTTPAASAGLHPSTAVAPALAAPLIAVPTHAPRNPFSALVNAAGTALNPAAVTPVTAHPAVAGSGTTGTTPAPVAAGGAASCSGHVHRVVGGDTLWTLAARAVRSHDTARVTIAWHRLYAANRAAVGADPSLLLVGTPMCMPKSL